MIPEDPIDPAFRAQVEEALRAELPNETLDPGLVDNLCRILATRGGELDAAHAATLYQLYRMAGRHRPGEATDPGSEDRQGEERDPGIAGMVTLEVPRPPSLSALDIPGCARLTLEAERGLCTSYRTVDAETGQPARVLHFQAGARHSLELDTMLHFLVSRAREPHPNLLNLKRHGRLEDGSDYLVFDGPEGVRLSELLREHGPLSVARACNCARQVALALQAIHACGYVHLDITPGSLLIGRDRQRVWIAEYPRVRPAGGAWPGYFVGTLACMAPEEARRINCPDARTDLYGLGCTLYEMLAGRSPFGPLFGTPGQDIRAREVALLVMEAGLRTGPPALVSAQEVPASVQRILRRLLAADPAQRYPDAASLIADLDALLHVPCRVSVSFPDEVAAGVPQRLNLVVSRVKSADSLPDPLPEQPGLTVSVAAENFRIDSPSPITIPLPPPGHPARLSFDLAGLAPGPGRVMLDFRQGTHSSGSLDLHPHVLPGPPPRRRGPWFWLLALLGGLFAGGLALAAAGGLDEERRKEDRSPWTWAIVATLTGSAMVAGLFALKRPRKAVVMTLPLDAAPAPGPDVLLKVHHHRLGGGPGQLHFSLCSSRPDLADLPVLDGDMGTCELHGDLAAWVDELLGSLADLAGSSMPPARVERTLADVGTQVFETIIPQRLRELYAILRQRGVRSLLVLSDEAHIPWELVRPYSVGQGGATSEEPPWAETFSLARWLRGRPPARSLPLRRALVVGAGLGGAPRRDLVVEKELASCLPSLVESVAAECELVRGLSARGTAVEVVAPRREAVRNALEAGGFDLLHVAGHGTRGTTPDGDALVLDDGLLRVLDLPPRLGPVLWHARPLVFFNACHSGRLGDGVVRPGSWGARLVELGCGGFVGTLWPVTDRAALTFARAFYARAGQGQAIGEVVWAARQEVRAAHPDDPSWLAYRCFADPTAPLGALPATG
jgi:serine/threonine protein kinase